MNKTAAILTHDTDRTYMVMQAVLGGLASVTMGGLAWAIWLGTENGVIKDVPEKERPFVIASAIAPPSEMSKAKPNEGAASVPIPAKAANPVQTASPIPVSPTASPGVPLAPSDVPAPSTLNVTPVTALPTTSPPVVRTLKNPQILEAIEASKLARKHGDMQASLEALRSADAKEPNHPLILSELALTYEGMGILTKATTAWRSIVAMGEQTAGSYFTLAKSRLEGRADSTLNNISAVKLGECQVIRDASAKKGERIAVRVPLLATPGAVIDPAQMDIHVYLFEAVNNGERIEQARATAPSLDWVSAPVDWKESSEELVDVVYDLPSPKPEELREFGQRKFHGYVVKLFYQNKLVGEEAQPASLRDFSPMRSGSAGLDSALFPKQ